MPYQIFDIKILSLVNSKRYLVETKDDNGDIRMKKNSPRKGGKGTVGNERDNDWWSIAGMDETDRDDWWRVT